jgi:hypothetical protein
MRSAHRRVLTARRFKLENYEYGGRIKGEAWRSGPDGVEFALTGEML